MTAKDAPSSTDLRDTQTKKDDLSKQLHSKGSDAVIKVDKPDKKDNKKRE
jgi:hypothetical protein